MPRSKKQIRRSFGKIRIRERDGRRECIEASFPIPDDLRFHDLRHTGLTLLAGQGATVRELMDDAGHSSPEMAMRYQHEVSSRERMLAERMGESIDTGQAMSSRARQERVRQIDEQIARLREEKERLLKDDGPSRPSI